MAFRNYGRIFIFIADDRHLVVVCRPHMEDEQCPSYTLTSACTAAENIENKITTSTRPIPSFADNTLKLQTPMKESERRPRRATASERFYMLARKPKK